MRLLSMAAASHHAGSCLCIATLPRLVLLVLTLIDDARTEQPAGSPMLASRYHCIRRAAWHDWHVLVTAIDTTSNKIRRENIRRCTPESWLHFEWIRGHSRHVYVVRAFQTYDTSTQQAQA